jgi:hypothetical protein
LNNADRFPMTLIQFWFQELVQRETTNYCVELLE